MVKPLALVALACAIVPTAHAADGAVLTANVGLTTNYKFRGQDQGGNKPALQGGFDFSSRGFYVGNWNSSIGFTDSGLEMDLYAGYKGEASGIGYDVGVLQYHYPQSNRQVDFDTTELYGAVSRGAFTAKYSHTVSKDYFGIGDAYRQAFGGPRPKGRGTGYLDLAANIEVARGLTLNGHVGFTRLAGGIKGVGVPDYADYKLGATYDLGSGFSLAGAVVGANKRGFYGDINKSRLIVTLGKSM